MPVKTFLSVVTDARAGGMGELGVATSPDNYSHQQNPAKYVFSDLKTVGKGGINVFYMPWLRRDFKIRAQFQLCRQKQTVIRPILDFIPDI